MLIMYHLLLKKTRQFHQDNLVFFPSLVMLTLTLFLLIRNETEMKHSFVVGVEVQKFHHQLLYLWLNFRDHNSQ